MKRTNRKVGILYDMGREQEPNAVLDSSIDPLALMMHQASLAVARRFSNLRTYETIANTPVHRATASVYLTAALSCTQQCRDFADALYNAECAQRMAEAGNSGLPSPPLPFSGERFDAGKRVVLHIYSDSTPIMHEGASAMAPESTQTIYVVLRRHLPAHWGIILHLVGGAKLEALCAEIRQDLEQGFFEDGFHVAVILWSGNDFTAGMGKSRGVQKIREDDQRTSQSADDLGRLLSHFNASVVVGCGSAECWSLPPGFDKEAAKVYQKFYTHSCYRDEGSRTYRGLIKSDGFHPNYTVHSATLLCQLIIDHARIASAIASISAFLGRRDQEYKDMSSEA